MYIAKVIVWQIFITQKEYNSNMTTTELEVGFQLAQYI